MEDIITTQVKLKSFNGEGLWVTPVSYMSCDYWGENKLRLYHTLEFPPDIDRGSVLKDSAHNNFSHFPKLFWLYSCDVIKSVTQQLFSNCENFFGVAVFDRVFSRRSWWNNVYYSIQSSLEKDWFYCKEVYPVNFHIEGNIELVRELGEGYWDEIYLTPTDRWVEERLAEKHLYTLNDNKDQVIESLENFYQWKKEQEDKGLSISYITSLET